MWPVQSPYRKAGRLANPTRKDKEAVCISVISCVAYTREESGEGRERKRERMSLRVPENCWIKEQTSAEIRALGLYRSVTYSQAYDLKCYYKWKKDMLNPRLYVFNICSKYNAYYL